MHMTPESGRLLVSDWSYIYCTRRLYLKSYHKQKIHSDFCSDALFPKYNFLFIIICMHNILENCLQNINGYLDSVIM